MNPEPIAAAPVAPQAAARRQLWLQAAVIASLWASSEIVLGSFLHNLNVPFCGYIMTGIAIIILVAGHRMAPRPGVLWRAGLLCAVMKSVSPSAVILSPMIAIFMEGLLMNAGVALLGARLPGYLLGGGLAMGWTVIHKVAALLILYGAAITEIYVRICQFAEKQTGLALDRPWALLLAFWCGLFVTGMVFAYGGWAVARRAVRAVRAPERAPRASAAAVWPHPTPVQTYSLALLLLGAVVALSGPFLIDRLPLGAATLMVLLYVLLFGWRYPEAFRRLRKPGFWLGFVLLTLLAGLFLGRTGGTFSREGLARGIEMNLRAILMVASFAALSVELGNPRVRHSMMRRGSRGFLLALEAAFSVLPEVVASLPSPRELLLRPLDAFAGVVARAEEWLERLEEIASGPVFVLTGPVNSGKTRFAVAVVERLRASGVSVAGILSPGLLEKGAKIGFDIVDAGSGQARSLCRRGGPEAWPGYGPFRFDPDGLAFGERACAAETLAVADVVVIDEVGRWELEGGGWSGILDRMAARRDFALILVAREEFPESIARRWRFRITRLWHAGQEDAVAVAEELRLRSEI